MSEPEAVGQDAEDVYEEETAPGSAGAGSEETAAAVAEPSGPLFEDDELKQFDDDDVTAGRAICVMLSLFFLYTVIAMALVGLWTFGASFGK